MEVVKHEDQNKPKRQMKTPFQLETLDKAYALQAYPSESLRAELSETLGLSDRQLQTWFCHKRLKDKKDTTMAKKPRTAIAADEDRVSQSGSDSISASMVGDDMGMVRRYCESPRTVSELRAIAFVEAQLGEVLREDGPIVGMEFDPLPPGAFGVPIAMAEQQKRSGHPLEGKVYERRHTKSIKAAARSLHKHQLLQDHSSMRSDAYGRVAPSHFNVSPVDGPSAKTSSLANGNEQLFRGCVVQGQVSLVNLLSRQGKQGHSLSSASVDYDCVPQRGSFMNIGMDAQFSGPSIVGPENPYVLSDSRISHNEGVLRMERKRKNEEARIVREVEAHEKRIPEELEKQDALRRKREELMRKEMEKHDRDRRKEEERLMRERQREEERFQREQRREIERRKMLLQKESLRAEKRRQKEELVREKEAAKLRAAIERATARRIARDSRELVEDERLELMELAASSKGFPSIISLDHDTLQNLDAFRDFLSAFPPKFVQLKRPFAIQPWIHSEENIGNLLMVWRFLITFADVLELWPFTFDEFVQAFHDYDSRLLGEIHVAVLKLIIKDIEDVARTPSIGLGTNQSSACSPEGGHPQIVEGAYAWGFDIRNWNHHLNPLTWPEILRQFALSAGFGPQLKKRKRSIERAYLHEDNEGKGCEDVVSTLRNGSAAENAVAMMREKGFSFPRRSGHRLTPGTVKFAAFHVLSLEGSKGLTILELADKIQKSGLRDLTTSKTPEASISVALSRDANLFERTAPSTYCVRPAFRKDPVDAEAILSAAREKMRIFENRFLPGEDADYAERDEVSECDVAEDPEVDLSTPLNEHNNGNHYNEVKTCSGNGKENFCNDVVLNSQNELDSAGKDSFLFRSRGSKDTNSLGTTSDKFIDVAGRGIGASSPDQGDTEIDESKSGELWVHGLTEGEYSYLSVEERLNALVALIAVANEGNSIRAVLEDRLEAANALKKQMWAEAQLDKRRLKEVNLSNFHYPFFMGSKAETKLTSSVAEGNQSQLPVVDDKNNEGSLSTAVTQEPFIGSNNVQNHPNNFPTERSLVVQDFSMGSDNFPFQQHGHTAEMSHSQLKSYLGHRAEEVYVYRSLPLGQDRRRNRYWQFVASASRNDPGSGRIFIESHDSDWRLIDSEEAFDSLLTSLDTRGIRESHLHSMLQKIETSFKENVRSLQCANIAGRSGITVKNEAEMGSSPDCTAGIESPSSTVCGLNYETLEPLSSFRFELGRNETEKKDALKRYQDYQRWMWKECFNSLRLCAMKCGKKRCTQLLDICDLCFDSYFSEDNHCLSCHRTFGTIDNSFNFSKHVIQCEEKRKVDPGNFHVSDSSLPLRIRLLKAMLTFIEVSVLPEALQSVWTENHRKTWGMKLHASSSPEDLLQILTLLEGVLKRDCLSSNFETTEDSLGSDTLSGSLLLDSAYPVPVPVLPWIPQTTAAVALRLLELDASISYILYQKAEPRKDKEAGESTRLPSRYALVKNIQEVEPTEMDQDEHMKEGNWADLGSGCNSSGCARGGRGQGRGRMHGSRWQKRVTDSRLRSGRKNVRDRENMNQRLQQGQRTHRQGRGRGRRTVRRRRAQKRVVEETLLVHSGDTASPNCRVDLPRNSCGEEWVGEEIRMMQMEGAENTNSAEAVESDDNAQAVEYEYGNWVPGFDGASNEKTGELMEVINEDVEGFDNDNRNEEGSEDLEEYVDMNEGSDGVDNGNVNSFRRL